MDRELRKGDYVRIIRPHLPERRGRVAGGERNELVQVDVWSERLGRYAHGPVTYHRGFLHITVIPPEDES